MIPIQTTYKIHANTFAIIPAKAIDYDTIVLEQNRKIHVRQTPMQIIEEACLHHWTTYVGRRNAVHQHTNFYQKVPLPISIQKQLYFFPTHSPKRFDNCWLAYQHILSVEQVNETTSTHPQTSLQFKDGQTLKLNISQHILQTQMDRTFQVMYQLQKTKKFYPNYHKL